MRNLVTVACVLVASTAFADHAKYSRKQDLVIDVKSSNRVKPIQARPSSGQPVVTADDALAIEEATDPLRREQETILIQLVNDTPDTDPDKPDYMFRLAEHYAKQLRLWRLKSVGMTITRAK